MTMKIVPTYWVNIYVGFKERYDGTVHTLEEAKAICRDFCDEIGLGLTLTPTNFVYTHGEEPGCIVGLIHYPRFPDEAPALQINSRAFVLAERLLNGLGQLRVSIVTPTDTFMLTSLQTPED